MSLAATFRLMRAGFILAREGAFSIVDIAALPPVMRTGVRLGRLFERGAVKRHGPADRFRTALDKLGPTYVKLGQTFATRPDIVGVEIAANLAQLQDKMEPFDPDARPSAADRGAAREGRRPHRDFAADRRRLDRPGAQGDAASQRHQRSGRGEDPAPRYQGALPRRHRELLRRRRVGRALGAVAATPATDRRRQDARSFGAARARSPARGRLDLGDGREHQG